MKASFTPREFRRLLELAWLGMQVAAGRQGGESAGLTRYLPIEQKLLAMAASMGCENSVTVGSDGKLIFSEQIDQDEEVRKIIGTYDNDTFWHELVHRLADRDLSVEQTLQLISGKSGPPINTDARLKQIEDGLWEEFEKFDLARFILLKAAKG